MVRSFMLVSAVVFLLPNLSLAQTGVQVNGTVGGAQLTIAAVNYQGNFVGSGKLTPPSGQFYGIKVTSGTVQQGRYVSLQGSLLAPNGTVAAPFTLNGDKNTGNIVFTYIIGGRTIQQTGKATIVIK